MHFKNELAVLSPIPFFPVLGNHEVKQLGLVSAGLGAEAERTFAHRFLSTPATPVKSVFAKQVVYSVDLAGGVHFVALDNVSQAGFGDPQLAWLENDLASTKSPHVVVGMHKALAKNGLTNHSMDEDGLVAQQDSARALALFQKNNVELVVASHIHGFAEFTQGGMKCLITGGLGAPLARAQRLGRYHHVIELEVGPTLAVKVVKFEGVPHIGDEDESPDP
jgi:3',5'-cyclic AMP phosphodiesterase CpdA